MVPIAVKVEGELAGLAIKCLAHRALVIAVLPEGYLPRIIGSDGAPRLRPGKLLDQSEVKVSINCQAKVQVQVRVQESPNQSPRKSI